MSQVNGRCYFWPFSLILFTTLRKSIRFFQMRKLQLREVNSLTQGHTAQPVVKPGGAYCLWSLWSCQVQVCGLIQAGCLDVTRKAC